MAEKSALSRYLDALIAKTSRPEQPRIPDVGSPPVGRTDKVAAYLSGIMARSTPPERPPPPPPILSEAESARLDASVRAYVAGLISKTTPPVDRSTVAPKPKRPRRKSGYAAWRNVALWIKARDHGFRGAALIPRPKKTQARFLRAFLAADRPISESDLRQWLQDMPRNTVSSCRARNLRRGVIVRVGMRPRRGSRPVALYVLTAYGRELAANPPLGPVGEAT